MGQLDNPRSIVLLFVGAFLISMGVIAFLNVEVDSRSNHGTKIRNENVFELLGRKISDTITSLRERNAYRRSLLYQVLISGNSTRSTGRRLMYFVERPNVSEDDVIENQSHNRFNKSLHKLRHKNKIRRLTEFHGRQKTSNRTSLPEAETRRTNSAVTSLKPQSDEHINVYFKKVNNRTLKWVRWTNGETNATSASSSDDDRRSSENAGVFREKFLVHRNCYSMNDVLEIIAITCLVNFIFWFMIITCVNFFTRNQKISKSDSCESLASIGTCSDYEIRQTQTQKNRGNAASPTPPKATYCRHSFVQDYVNSLAADRRGSSGDHHMPSDPQPPCRTFRLHVHQAKRWFGSEIADPSVPEMGRKCRRTRRLVPFCTSNVASLFDVISLDNVKPFLGRKKGLSEEKQVNLLNPSHSMENLIF